MDDDALRAMLPMGFGKGAGGASFAPSAVPAEAVGGADTSDEFDDDDDDDDNENGDNDSHDKPSALEPLPSATAPAPEPNEPIPKEAPSKGKELATGHESQDAQVDTGARDEAPASPVDLSHLDEYAGLPLTSSIQWEGHARAAFALAIDRSGTRVATGSMDSEVKMWDFGGMTTAMKPFKTFEPVDNYPVIGLSFSPQNRNLLCLCATTQPRVYDYDGYELAVFKKGDVFMRDMKHTTGHITDMTCGGWHPQNDTEFVTSGTDSTVRLWDLNETGRQRTVIVVRSKDRGTKTKVTAVAYTQDARAVLATGEDGAMYVWSTTGNYARPSATVQSAHARGQGATSLVVAADGHTLVSRGGDDTVKLWDMRQLREPVAIRTDMPNGSEHTDVIFSPDGSQVLTGLAAVPQGTSDMKDPQSKWGQLAALDARTLETKLVYPVSESSVIRMAWHPRLNQVLATSRDGHVHVYYDKHASKLGALLAVSKRARVRVNPYAADPSTADPYADVPITIPEEEEDWIDPEYKKPQFPKNAKNMRVPQRPLEGRGKGGRIGRSEMAPLMADLWEGDYRAEDPREYVLWLTAGRYSSMPTPRKRTRGSPAYMPRRSRRRSLPKTSLRTKIRLGAHCRRRSLGTRYG